MATEITSKEELASLTAKLDGKSLDVTEVISDLKSSLSGISNYDGIDVSSAANTLSNNLSNISKDLENVVTNIKNYVSQVTGFDIDDFNVSSDSSSSSSVSYEDIFRTDGSKEQNARVIWNFLKYKGLSDAAAAGVLGNIQAESGFNPGIEEIANGIGYGLIQWSFGRRTALENAAKAAGVDPSNLQFQLEYLWDESLDPNTSYGKKLASAGFYTTNDPGDAAYYFHKFVEISADSKSAIQNNRCAPAESWYDKFKGTDAGDVEGQQSVSWDAVTTTTAATVIAGTKTNSNSSNYYSSYSSGYSGGNSSSGGYSGGSYSGSSSSSGSHVQRGAVTKVTISSGDPNIDVSKYHNNLELGFKVTVGNLAYKLDDKDIELLCAIVAAESDKSYDDALAVITTILNRCESPNWINSHGTDPIAQATAPNQFVVYQHGSYMSYMDGKAPEEVVAAVKDALAGVRNHEYLSFRSNGTTTYSDNMITSTGNRYK